MTEEENAAYDDLVDEVDKLNDRVRDLLSEMSQLRRENAIMRDALTDLYKEADADLVTSSTLARIRAILADANK